MSQPPSLPIVTGPGYPQKTSGLAIASLVLGILGMTCLNVICGIPALICGHASMSKIKNSGGTLGGRGIALAGTILGYLSFAVLGLLMLIAVPNFMRARSIAIRNVQRTICVQNLLRIDDAKQKWALENKKQAKDVPTAQDLAPYLTNGMPHCPSGGTYSINANDQSPTCSIPGHQIQ